MMRVKGWGRQSSLRANQTKGLCAPSGGHTDPLQRARMGAIMNDSVAQEGKGLGT